MKIEEKLEKYMTESNLNDKKMEKLLNTIKSNTEQSQRSVEEMKRIAKSKHIKEISDLLSDLQKSINDLKKNPEVKSSPIPD